MVEGNSQRSHVTEQENDLAQTAMCEFNKNNYGACLSLLQKLEQMRKQDYKVLHNKAVVEFYKSDFKKTDLLVKSLNSIGEPCFNDEGINLDDVDHCALYYNHAVILLHQRKFNIALRIIQKVFTFIEPMEESLAHKVCLLLLELLLILRRVDEALSYVQYIMMQFASTKNIQGLEKEPTEKKPVIFDAATDAFRLKLLQYQTRCYLYKGLVVAAQNEMGTILSTGGENSVHAVFLQANIEYLQSNYDKAINLLKSVRSMEVDTKAHLPVMFYNNLGCIYHQLGKKHLAAFYFRKALEDVDVVKKMDRSLFTNHYDAVAELMYNTGIAFLFAGNPIPAFEYLLQAVQVFHMNPRLWLRMAECCIMAHKKCNDEDFSIHSKKKDILKGHVGSGYHRKLLLSKKISENDSNNVCEQSYAIPTPTLEFASICLKNALILLPPEVAGERKDASDPPAEPIPTNSGPKNPIILQETERNNTRNSMFGAPSSLFTDTEVRRLRISALCASSYVALCLGDYTLALETASDVLKEPAEHVSGAHAMIARLYAAEALLHLDRSAQALIHLQPEFHCDVDILSSSVTTDINRVSLDSKINGPPPYVKYDWFPSSLLTANIIVQYNLAASHAIRGELDTAAEMLKCLWLLRHKVEMPIQIVMLTLYIEIRLANYFAPYWLSSLFSETALPCSFLIKNCKSGPQFILHWRSGPRYEMSCEPLLKKPKVLRKLQEL